MLRPRFSAQWNGVRRPNRRQRRGPACEGGGAVGLKEGCRSRVALPSSFSLHCLDILTRYRTVRPFYHLPSAYHRHRLAKMSKLPKFGRELRQIKLLVLGSMLALAGAGPL